MPVTGQKYIDVVFASSGSTTPIPDGVQGDGSVSFAQGYGANYTLPQGSPGVLNVEEVKMNYLFNLITSILQIYQQQTIAPYISATANNGSAYAYGQYAVQLFTDGHVYESLLPSNAAAVVNDGVNWKIVDASSAPYAVVGSMRNAKMSVTTASASATFTADQIVVQTALNGVQFLLPNYSESINISGTGAGGMDTGSAPTSGFVALYAIYGPSGTSILGANATSAAAPNIYGGAHMPSGYTASALIGVWPTNSSGQLIVGYLTDRQFIMFPQTAISSSSSNTNFAATPTSLSISGIVPANAKTISGIMIPSGNSPSATVQIDVMSASSGLGEQTFGAASVNSGGSGSTGVFNNLPIITSQTMYYRPSTIAGTNIFTINITGYTI